MPQLLAQPNLVQIARDLAQVLAEGDDEADRDCRLPQRVAHAMAEAGLYRTAVARAWGGHEADPLTMIRTIEAVSEASGAAGWNLMIALEGSGLASGSISEAGAAATYLADPLLIMSASLTPAGRARPVPGGWRISGRWTFVSGCHNAAWFWAGTLMLREDGEIRRNAAGNPSRRQMLVPASAMDIVETWNVAGLRGSGSHDVVLNDAFVPEHLVTDLYGAGMQQDTPLFRYPIFPRLCYIKVGVATGIARASIDAFAALAGAKTPFASRTLLRDKAHAQLAIAEAEALWASGRAFLFEAVREMWELVCAREPISDELRVRHRLACAHAVASSVRAVELVHRSAGSTANFRESPIERRFRDVHVVQQHATVQPAVYEQAGRAMLGLGLESGSF